MYEAMLYISVKQIGPLVLVGFGYCCLCVSAALFDQVTLFVVVVVYGQNSEDYFHVFSYH